MGAGQGERTQGPRQAVQAGVRAPRERPAAQRARGHARAARVAHAVPVDALPHGRLHRVHADGALELQQRAQRNAIVVTAFGDAIRALPASWLLVVFLLRAVRGSRGSHPVTGIGIVEGGTDLEERKSATS